MSAQPNPPRDGEVAARRADGGGYPSLRRPETYTARRLRKDMSLPEVPLWQELRGSKQGVKFRRQHPVGPYVADFYCAAAKLIIEIDGEAHNCGTRPERDINRDAYLKDNGYRVLRVPASDVLNGMDDVLTMIKCEAESPLHHSLTRTVPLPASGEEFV